MEAPLAAVEIATLASFARALLAARQLAAEGAEAGAVADLVSEGGGLRAFLGARRLDPLAQRVERAVADADRAFARDGSAKEDARRLFHQVAGPALTGPAAMAENGLDPAAIAEAMVAAIHASRHARDFRAAELAERYFRAVAGAALQAALNDPAFVEGLGPRIARESLRRHGETHARLAAQDAELADIKAMLARVPQAQAARETGISEAALIGLARRVAVDVADVDQAFRELENAVEIAIRVQEEGRAGSNLGDFVDDVLREAARLAAAGDYDRAADRIEAALAREAAESRARTLRLLAAGVEQDLLRRAPEAAAAKLAREAALERAAEESAFDALRRVQDEWHAHGRDKGVNLHLEVAIALARRLEGLAGNPAEVGLARNDLGVSLAVLGEREADSTRLEQAIVAHKRALEEWTRDRAPLDWAFIQGNLASVHIAFFDKTGDPTRLDTAEAHIGAARELFATAGATELLRKADIMRDLVARRRG